MCAGALAFGSLAACAFSSCAGVLAFGSLTARAFSSCAGVFAGAQLVVGSLFVPAVLLVLVGALAGFLGRGLDCGAVTEPELADLVGLDRPGLDALR